MKKDWRLHQNIMGKCFKCGKKGKFQTWEFFYKGRHRLASWCSKKCYKAIKGMTTKKWKEIYVNYHCKKCAGFLDLKEKKDVNK